MKGNFEGSSAKLVSVMSDFVEEQKNKDLLDVSHTQLGMGVAWYTHKGLIDAADPPIGRPFDARRRRPDQD